MEIFRALRQRYGFGRLLFRQPWRLFPIKIILQHTLLVYVWCVCRGITLWYMGHFKNWKLSSQGVGFMHCYYDILFELIQQRCEYTNFFFFFLYSYLLIRFLFISFVRCYCPLEDHFTVSDINIFGEISIAFYFFWIVHNLFAVFFFCLSEQRTLGMVLR